MEIDTAAIRDRERCPSCGSLLAFKGFSKSGERVLGCQAAITFYRQDQPTTMVPCDLEEKLFFIGGKTYRKEQVLWWPKPRFRRGE